MITVDPSNQEQREAWDGPRGGYWSEHADRMDTVLGRYQPAFLAAVAAAPGQRVLDVGCGNGATSCAVAGAGASVLGVDLSSEMLAVARARARGLAGVEFVEADAQVHPFPAGAFDTAISRHGVMFFGDPPAAFANIARAVRPGGRLVLLVWRTLAENSWMREILAALGTGGELTLPAPGSPGPMALGDPDRLRELVSGAGFDDVTLTALAEPMWFGADAGDAHRLLPEQFSWALAELSPAGRQQALAALWDLLVARETSDGVLLDSSAWLVTAARSGGR